MKRKCHFWWRSAIVKRFIGSVNIEYLLTRTIKCELLLDVFSTLCQYNGVFLSLNRFNSGHYYHNKTVTHPIIIYNAIFFDFQYIEPAKVSHTRPTLDNYLGWFIKLSLSPALRCRRRVWINLRCVFDLFKLNCRRVLRVRLSMGKSYEFNDSNSRISGQTSWGDHHLDFTVSFLG